MIAGLRLLVEKALPVCRHVAWRHLTEPELINRWSQARVEPRHVEGGPAAGERRVAIRLGPLAWHVDEVIEIAEAPSRLVYRVTPRFPVRRHRGEVTLAAHDGTTQLRWKVDFDLFPPGVAVPVGRLIDAQLRASLDALAGLLAAEAGAL
jgi:uncharacterized protein YndB with AHSA1/START domain